MRDADGSPAFDRKHQLIPQSIAGNARAAVKTIPALDRVPAVRSWVGTTTVAPDQLPLVGAVKGAPEYSLPPADPRSRSDRASHEC